MKLPRESLRLFWWHTGRYILRHPLLAILNVFAIGLGVAVFLAIQIANGSANQAFNAGIDVVAGKAHLEISSPSGRLDESIYPAVAALPEIEAATPVIRTVLPLPDYPGDYLDLIAVDLFTNQPFSTFTLSGERDDFDLESWIGKPNGVAITETFASAHQLKLGDSLRVRVNGRDLELHILNLMKLSDAPAGTHSRLAAMDIGWAQELLGTAGYLSSIQLRLRDPNRSEAAIDTLKKVAPSDAIVAAPSQRSLQVQKMLSGFQLNLTALSLISLLVGMFLIYNTISASVVRRRQEIGILRSMGVTRAEVLLLFLGEAFLMALIGTSIGVLGGSALAGILVKGVSGTISSLYVLVAIDRTYLSPQTLLWTTLLGIASVLLAALHPALEATRLNPVEPLNPGHLQERARRSHRLWVVAAMASLGAAAASGILSLQGMPWLGFISAFFVLLGFALLLPGFATLLALLLHAIRFKLPILVVLAAQNLVRGIHRSAVTAAALMATIAMTVGISVMIYSFRQTVDLWVDHMVRADLFLAPSSGATAGVNAFVSPDVVEAIRKDPDIDYVETFRDFEIPWREGVASLSVLDGLRNRSLRFVGGGDNTKKVTFQMQDCVAVSESFARRHKVDQGDSLPLLTPGGAREFKVAGVYLDYSRDQGTIAITRENFARYWSDTAVNSIALFLKDPYKLNEVEVRFRSQFSQGGELALLSNRTLRARIFEIFDQTFSVTYILRTISLIVAALGIFLAFTIAVTERQRELALLRSLGGSRGQLQKLLIAESGLIGLLASVTGVAAGAVLSIVLTYVINPAFFGWSIQLWIPWSSILVTPLWMIPVSMLAGWVPAWRASHAPVAAALRSE